MMESRNNDDERDAVRPRQQKRSNDRSWISLGVAAASLALSAYVCYHQYKRLNELERGIENVRGAVNTLGDYVTQINGDLYVQTNSQHTVEKMKKDIKQVADYVASVSGDLYALTSSTLLK